MSKTIKIEEDFYEHLLNCLANQKFIGEAPPNGDALAMGKRLMKNCMNAIRKLLMRHGIKEWKFCKA